MDGERTMTCEAIRIEMQAVLDGEGTPNLCAKLAEHIENCHSCRQALDELLRFNVLFADLGDNTVQAEMKTRTRVGLGQIEEAGPLGRRKANGKFAVLPSSTCPVTSLKLAGDLDEGAVDVFRAALFECISDGRCNIIMDFSQVRFVSYMGLGVLVERLRHIRAAGGDIKLVGINLYAERLFRMVGVSGLFETYDNEASALNAQRKLA